MEKLNCKYFYKWLKKYGYHLVYDENIFRGKIYITSFDPIEDGDSGEVEETIRRIKVIDDVRFE